MLGNEGHTLAERKAAWQRTKLQLFNQLSQNPASMFNYFLENNDIFKAIRKEDVEEFQRLQNSSFIETMNAFLTTFVVTAITSEYIIPRYMPKFHIQSFRTVLVAIKYFVFPGYVAKKYSALDRNHYARSVWEMQSKYAFGFEDFNRYNYLFDRALAVDRLDELLEKRDKFDWTGVHDDSVI